LGERKLLLLKCIVIFVIGLFLFSFHYGDFELTKIDCRFGLFAKEMASNGVTLFPTLYGKPYPDYPATHTVLVYLTYLLTGRMSPFTAGFSTAVVGAALLLLIYLVGRERSEKTGIWGVLLALMTYEFVSDSRSPSPDIFVAFTAAAAFLSVYYAEYRHNRLILCCVPFCLLTGFILRGPIGLVIPAAIVFVFYVIEKKYLKAFLCGFVSFVLLSLCVWGLYKLAVLQGGQELGNAVLEAQAGGRISKQKPIFYYFVNGLGNYAISFPLALLFLALIAKKITKSEVFPDRKFILHMTGWALIIFAGMSVPGTKHMRYVLAAVPPLAILAALIFEERDWGIPFFKHLKTWLLKAFSCMPVVMLVALVAIWSVFKLAGGCIKNVPCPPIPFVGAALFLIAVIAVVGYLRRTGYFDKAILNGCSGAACMVFAVIFFIEPFDQSLENSRDFVVSSEKVRGGQGGLVFYRIGPDGEDIKYSINLEKPVRPLFVWGEEDLLNLKPGDVAVAKENDFKKLSPELRERFSVIVQGGLGHRECVAFCWK